MTLSKLIRRGWLDSATATHATYATRDSEKAGTVAKVATVAVANEQDTPNSSYGWVLRFPDGRVIEAYRTNPEYTRSEVLEDFPEAVDAEPVKGNAEQFEEVEP